MKDSVFWKAFEETGKVADYLRYKYEGEGASYLNSQSERTYEKEALRTSEEQKWQMQLQ